MLDFSNGDYIHVYNRGVRKQDIFREKKDYWHFLQALFYLNDINSIDAPFYKLREKYGKEYFLVFKRPEDWPNQEKIVHILAFTLMPNHFHLLLRVISEQGTSLFMKKLSNSVTGRFNKKYKETGSLFQGRYKYKRIDTDASLNYISYYIQIKNPFELYKGGLSEAMNNFNDAYKWSSNYEFSSLGAYAGVKESPIIDKEALSDIDPKEYKILARNYLYNLNEVENSLSDIIFTDHA